MACPENTARQLQNGAILEAFWDTNGDVSIGPKKKLKAIRRTYMPPIYTLKSSVEK